MWLVWKYKKFVAIQTYWTISIWVDHLLLFLCKAWFQTFGARNWNFLVFLNLILSMVKVIYLFTFLGMPNILSAFISPLTIMELHFFFWVMLCCVNHWVQSICLILHMRKLDFWRATWIFFYLSRKCFWLRGIPESY